MTRIALFKFLLLFLGVTLGSLFLYFRTLNGYFISDGYEWWKLVRGLDFLGSFRLFLPSDFGGIGLLSYYRPIVGWTIWLDTVPFKMTPLAFHLTTLAFHIFNTTLVGILGYYLFKRNYKAALIASILFSVFPFHSEAVIYSVGGRYNVVMTTFYLLSFLAIVRYHESRKLRWACLACLTFLLGLLSLESAVTLPISALCFLVIFSPAGFKKTIRSYRYFLFALVGVFLFYFSLRSFTLHTLNPYSLTGYMNERVFSRVLQLYLGVFLVLVLIHLLVGRLHKIFGSREKLLWFLFVLTGILFLPTVYIPTQERHLYLPSFASVLFLSGLIISIDEWLIRMKSRFRIGFWCSILLIIILNGRVLFTKNENWRFAADLAETTTSQLTQIVKENPKETVIYLLNFPDSVNGVYVYRVRMQEAIEFKLGKTAPRLIFTPGTIGLKSKIISADRKRIITESAEGYMLFLPKRDDKGKYTVTTDDYRAIQLNDKTLSIEFLNADFDTQKSKIYVFEDGEIKVL